MFQMKLDMVASWLSCTLFSGCGLCLVAFLYYIIAVPVAGTGGVFPVVGAGPVAENESPRSRVEAGGLVLPGYLA